MSSNAPVTPPDGDYLAVEGAVLETARGRWFLSEFASRHRASDTESVLRAIAKLEQALAPALPGDVDRQLGDLLRILAKARAASWGGFGDDSRPAHLAAMQTAESAMSAIRKTAEKIREVAFELRESARLDVYAEALDLYCADLGSAAGLQEAATRQLTELAALLGAVETRVASLTGGGPPGAVAADGGSTREAERAPAGDGKAAQPVTAPTIPVAPAKAEAKTAPPIQPAGSNALPAPSAPAVPPRERGGRAMLFVRPNGLPRRPF